MKRRPFHQGLVTTMIVLCMTIILTGCSDPVADLTGTWRLTSGEYADSILTLNADSSGRLSVKGGVNYDLSDWQGDGGRITMIVYEESVLLEYTVSEDVLTISNAPTYAILQGRWMRQP